MRSTASITPVGSSSTHAPYCIRFSFSIYPPPLIFSAHLWPLAWLSVIASRIRLQQPLPSACHQPEKDDIRDAITGNSRDPISRPTLHTFYRIWRIYQPESSSDVFIWSYHSPGLFSPTPERDVTFFVPLFFHECGALWGQDLSMLYVLESRHSTPTARPNTELSTPARDRTCRICFRLTTILVPSWPLQFTVVNPP